MRHCKVCNKETPHSITPCNDDDYEIAQCEVCGDITVEPVLPDLPDESDDECMTCDHAIDSPHYDDCSKKGGVGMGASLGDPCKCGNQIYEHTTGCKEGKCTACGEAKPPFLTPPPGVKWPELQAMD